MIAEYCWEMKLDCKRIVKIAKKLCELQKNHQNATKNWNALFDFAILLQSCKSSYNPSRLWYNCIDYERLFGLKYRCLVHKRTVLVANESQKCNKEYECIVWACKIAI